MVENCVRTCSLSRRLMAVAATLAVGFSVSAAAQTAPASKISADAENYSSSTAWTASLGTDALLGAAPAGPVASASPQYGGHTNYPSYSNYSSTWSHIAFEGGGGFTAPLANDTHPYEAPGYNVNETWGWNIGFGGGWNFTKKFGVLLQYQFDKQKVPGATLSTIYNEAVEDGVSLPYTLSGNVNTWSLTVDPVYYQPVTHSLGVYVTGGGGFYRKVTNFSEPELVEEEYGFIYEEGYENETVAHSSSNQGGINAGFGVYWKAFGPDSSGKLFAQSTYVWVDSPVASNSDPWGGGTEGLIPITLGVRF